MHRRGKADAVVDRAFADIRGEVPFLHDIALGNVDLGEHFDYPGDVRGLIEGNVRHVVIKNEEGRTLIEFPVSIGLAGALLLPVWAAVGAVAAMVTHCTIEVERDKEEEGEGAEE